MAQGNAIDSKRKVVYCIKRNLDSNLAFVKRRRVRDGNGDCDTKAESLSDAEKGNEVSGCDVKNEVVVQDASSDSAPKGCTESDTEEESKVSRPQTAVSLRQSVDIEDIKKIKEENLRRKDDSGNLPLDLESSVGGLWSSCQPKSRIQEVIDDPVRQRLERLALREKYQKRYNLPPILFLSDLIIRIQPYLPVIKDMYQQVLHSHYKFEATNASKASKNAFLSLEEFRSMNISRFLAGYYGLKRQLSVGEEILRHFRPYLLRRQGETMKWWGITDFANYVLAPEVLASFCIKEMNLGDDIYDSDTREKAYELFHNTVEFGLNVADKEPLEKWELGLEKEERLKELGLGPFE